MVKKINHKGHGGHRELLFSLCPLCSLWFSKPVPEDNKKSLPGCRKTAHITNTLQRNVGWCNNYAIANHRFVSE